MTRERDPDFSKFLTVSQMPVPGSWPPSTDDHEEEGQEFLGFFNTDSAYAESPLAANSDSFSAPIEPSSEVISTQAVKFQIVLLVHF